MSKNKDIVYGLHPILEAIKAGKEFDKILLQKNSAGDQLKEVQKIAFERRIPVSKVPIEKLNKITGRNHQGVIGFVSAIEFSSLDHVVQQVYQQGKDPFILLLDQVKDVRNFGAIARTAECAGVNAIVIPYKGSAQINQDAVKTSAGALNYIPVCRESSLLSAVKFLKNNGLQIFTATEKAQKSVYESELKGPAGLVLGSEEYGISNEIIRICDQMISIPVFGHINSLNVSVAAAVCMYEVVRQRNLIPN